MMDVVFQLNLELMLIFFENKLLDYDDWIICELLEFGAPVGFESNILEENEDIVNHKGAREFEDDVLKYLYKEAS